jgi:molecular chaperone Hsp31 and glyoxalase 3
MAALKVKKFLKMTPEEIEGDEGCFLPSPFAMWMTLDKKATFTEFDYPVQGSGKVLVICTSEKDMIMENGSRFRTGNNPVEALIPMRHLAAAGFTLEVATLTGEPAVIEEHFLPKDDPALDKVYQEYKPQFWKPSSLQEIVKTLQDDSYVAVFIPGGHGAMLGLPESDDVNKTLQWAVAQDKFVLTICHGPAALLSAKDSEDATKNLFQGYKLVVFPDSIDKRSPMIGYLPGEVPWLVGERLEEAGLTVANTKKSSMGRVHKDRKLITGDSPKAANAFGKLAVDALLESQENPEQAVDALLELQEEPEQAADALLESQEEPEQAADALLESQEEPEQ